MARQLLRQKEIRASDGEPDTLEDQLARIITTIGPTLTPGPTGLITITGSVIDVDVSVLEETLAPQLSVLLDEVGDFLYVGEAVPGTASSAPSWRIFRVDNNPAGAEETTKLYANSSINFDQIWDDRLSFSYA